MGLAVSSKRKQQELHRDDTARSGRGQELAAIEFLMKLGDALHRYGTAADRIEEAVSICARRLKIEANVLAAPTSLQVHFETKSRSVNRMIRLGESRTDLEKLVEVDRIMDRWLAGEVGPQQAKAELEALRERPARFGALSWVLSYGMTSCLVSVLMGVDGGHVIGAGVLGLMAGVLVLLLSRNSHANVLVNPVVGFAASAGALIMVGSEGAVEAPLITIAALLVLLPGNTITTALRELATGHLTAGTTRLSSALMSLLGLAIGVAVGHRVIARYSLLDTLLPALPLPAGSLYIALALLPLCLMVQYHARPRDLLVIAFGSLIAWVGVRNGQAIAPDFGVALGAFLVGISSNIYSRIFDRPADVMKMPGIILLVPGSIGFRSLLSLLERDTISGVETLVTMMIVAAALVFGLLLANFVVAPRKVL